MNLLLMKEIVPIRNCYCVLTVTAETLCGVWTKFNKHTKQWVIKGGRAEQILNNKNIGGEDLTNDDILVIMCGTNNVAVDVASKATEHIENILKETSKKHRVVLVDLPQRYDLLGRSCVSEAVHSTNKQLKE